jgi:hypothetical protein
VANDEKCVNDENTCKEVKTALETAQKVHKDTIDKLKIDIKSANDALVKCNEENAEGEKNSESLNKCRSDLDAHIKVHVADNKKCADDKKRLENESGEDAQDLNKCRSELNAHIKTHVDDNKKCEDDKKRLQDDINRKTSENKSKDDEIFIKNDEIKKCNVARNNDKKKADEDNASDKASNDKIVKELQDKNQKHEEEPNQTQS